MTQLTARTPRTALTTEGGTTTSTMKTTSLDNKSKAQEEDALLGMEEGQTSTNTTNTTTNASARKNAKSNNNSYSASLSRWKSVLWDLSSMIFPQQQHPSVNQKRHYTKKGGGTVMVIRRMFLGWSLLSNPMKWMTFLLSFLIGQHLFISLWDQLFYQVGDLDSITLHSGRPLTGIQNTESTFAVVINTYRRPDRLNDAVKHYADTCGRDIGITQVYIIWADLVTPPPDPNIFFIDDEDGHLKKDTTTSHRATIHVLQKSKDSLNSRFEPIPTSHRLESTAIFMVDDDIRVSCQSLRHGFEAWRTRPDAMVGYYPRLATPPRRNPSTSSLSNQKELIYHTWPVVFWTQTFNFVLTKASFLHSKYLDLYTDDKTFPKAIKDHVDEHKNCEDIAMSLLVANYTNYYHSDSISNNAPIYVEGHVKDTGLFGGISSGSGHMTTRSECVTLLTTLLQDHGWPAPFGNNPLPLQPNSWIRHAPGFWWQIRPSNFFEWFALANTLT